MRDIKFRGIHKGEWVYGSHVTDNKTYFAIVSENPHDECEMINQHVDVESVGQFTGLQDKNGVDIYEGDIVKTDGGSSCGDFDTGVISFVGAAFVVNDGDVNWVFHGINCSYHEVIGNKFESPELLEQ